MRGWNGAVQGMAGRVRDEDEGEGEKGRMDGSVRGVVVEELREGRIVVVVLAASWRWGTCTDAFDSRTSDWFTGAGAVLVHRPNISPSSGLYPLQKPAGSTANESLPGLVTPWSSGGLRSLS
jgi:hypothetical protein